MIPQDNRICKPIKRRAKGADLYPEQFGEDRWTSRKSEAITASRLLYQAASAEEDPDIRHRVMKRAGRMGQCSRNIIVTLDSATGELRVAKATLCRDRLCPICSWRLAMQRTFEMQQTIARVLDEHPGTRGLMLTLTVKNCDRHNLGDTIGEMCRAFTKLKKHRKFDRFILGYARSVEVTYSARYDNFHPHIHALLLVPEDYNARSITQPEWATMWRKAAGLDYDPVVDVRYAYRKDEDDPFFDPEDEDDEAGPDVLVTADRLAELREAVVEASKYALKPQAMRAVLCDELAASLAVQISAHHLVSYGGVIKDARAALGFTSKDEPADELPETPLVEQPQRGTLQRLAYTWASYTQSWMFVSEINDDDDEAVHLSRRRANNE